MASVEVAAVEAAQADALPSPPALEDALEKWRQDWQARDINAYLAWYAEDFVPAQAGQSRAQWKAQRQTVFAKASADITVAMLHRAISTLNASDADSLEGIVEFDQLYRSSIHSDQGRKTMRWRWKNGQWRILSEGFRPCTAKPNPKVESCLSDAKE